MNDETKIQRWQVRQKAAKRWSRYLLFCGLLFALIVPSIAHATQVQLGDGGLDDLVLGAVSILAAGLCAGYAELCTQQLKRLGTTPEEVTDGGL